MSDAGKNRSFISVEVGNVGTYEFDGLVVDKIVPELSGRQGRIIYEKMRADATVSAILFAIEMMLSRTTWRCVPNDTKNEESLRLAEFYDSLRDDMYNTWRDFLSEVLSMLTYGWSFFEIVGKRRLGLDAQIPSKYNDGKWGIHKLALRGQETLYSWTRSDNGDLLAMNQLIVYGPKAGLRTIPMSKGLLFRAGSWKDSPEGISPLRGAYTPWLLLQGINRAEAYGIERELNGLPVMEIPQDVMKAAQDGDADAKKAIETYRQIVRDVRLNKQAGVIIPSDCFQDADGTITAQKQYKFSLLNSNGSRSINVQSAAERHQTSIARCVLADFLMLGTSSKGGSQALGQSRFQFFADALDGWNASICEVLNRFLVPCIAGLNGFNIKNLPRYTTESVSPVDVETLTSCIERYSRSGGVLLPDPQVDSQIRERLGLPELDVERMHGMYEYDPTLDPRRAMSNMPNAQSGLASNAPEAQGDWGSQGGAPTGNDNARKPPQQQNKR